MQNIKYPQKSSPFKVLTLLFSILIFFSSYSTLKAQIARGGDVGWLSQMEASGYLFYDANGVQKDCFDILKSYGINSIRLRVWVNPSGGWCGKTDVVAVATRAKNKGMRLMIDFHYSDTFADPGVQTKPAAWVGHTFAQLKTDVYNHTYDVLNTLKTAGITPEWVQVGNETNDGMLWPDGKASTSMANFAALINQGYNAVKAVSSTIKVVVHLANGYDNTLFQWMFTGLTNNGATFDVIGMSVYPDPATWATTTAQAKANMDDLIVRYPGKSVIVSECGLPYTSPGESKAMVVDLVNKVKAVSGGKGLGVFWWEPQCYNNWQGYSKGAMTTTGRPTIALEGFLYDTYNLSVNQGFDADGVATQTPTGWTEWSNGNLDAGYTQAGGYSSTAFRLSHYKATAYQMSTYQIVTGLANGTYTLRAWVMGSGGQTAAWMSAKNYGGTEKDANIPTTGTWTQIMIAGINVTNGQCTIGFWSDAAAGNWINVDNVEFYKSVSSTARMATGEESSTVVAEETFNPNAVHAFPNPFKDHFNINYELDVDQPVKVTLYNTAGNPKVLIQETQTKGAHSIEYNAEHDVPGLYIVKIDHGTKSFLHKVYKTR